MKTKNLLLSVVASCLISGVLLPGCNGAKQNDSNVIKVLKVEEEARLQDDSISPTCKITIGYQYLVESATDSIALRINRAIQANTLGEEYAQMAPEAAIDSFRNAYIANYRKDLTDFYQEDVKKGGDIPQWYNYEYGLETRFDDGKEGILNCMTETFEYTGGAHPNSWNRWMNFEKSTGKLLTLKDVFTAEAEKPVCEMLLQELIVQMAARMEDSSITSLEGLRNAGILNTTDMYVPDNFLLGKDKVTFLYNKYDIAPYAMGTITLSLPYSSLEKYMIR